MKINQQQDALRNSSTTFDNISGMDLLCCCGAGGPYILYGAQNRREHCKSTHIGASPAYQLVVVEDGVVPYRLAGKTRQPMTPYALFIAPATDIEVNVPQGVTWHLLTFDAVYQPRRFRPGNPVRWCPPASYVTPSFHTTSKHQPAPLRVWGVDLPLEVPHEVLAECIARVRFCNARWWRSPTDYARANHQLGLWLLDFVDSARRSSPERRDWLGTLTHYCNEQMVHGLTVADLARVAGVSRQQLRNRLLAATGMTPKEFMDHIRIDEACRLLRTTPVSVRGVSTLCGYSSLPVLARRFHKYTGMSPTRWRRVHAIPSHTPRLRESGSASARPPR